MKLLQVARTDEDGRKEYDLAREKFLWRFYGWEERSKRVRRVARTRAGKKRGASKSTKLVIPKHEGET